MKRCSLILVAFTGYLHVLTAQDSVLAISGLVNTQTGQQDSVVVVSTFGHFPTGTYMQDGLIISFEPFPLLFGDSVSTSILTLPPIEGFHIYPNPAHDFAILNRQTDNERYIITLYHRDGTMIRELSWDDGRQMQVALEDLVGGIYLMTVMDENQTKASCYRIIKQ